MKFAGFLLCMLLMHTASAVDGLLLKHLTPKPGGIIDSLMKPKIQTPFQGGAHANGGMSFGIGPFGFSFGYNKQYVPPGGGNLPPKEPIVPGGKPGYSDENPHAQGMRPEYPGGNADVPGISTGIGPFGFSFSVNKQFIPGGVNLPPKHPIVPGGKPGYPDDKPFVPGVKPDYPDVPGVEPGYPHENPYVPGVKPVIPVKPQNPKEPSWEEEDDDEKVPHYPRPQYPKDEKDLSKPEAYEDDKTGSPKREDTRPDWEDIGENPKPKWESYMDSDLVGDGLIQPRLNKKQRSRRSVDSRVFHVPLLFRSNAKPFNIKVQNRLNSLMKTSIEK